MSRLCRSDGICPGNWRLDVVSLREAAERRAEAAEDKQERSGPAQWRSAPDGVLGLRPGAPVRSECRAERAEKDGKEFLRLVGEASVYERTYEMWDWAGPYEEIVSEGAGAVSLAAGPDVAFLANHTGIAFARTRSGTLTLSEPGGSLTSDALMNPARQDAQDLWESVDEKSMPEMSFAFYIKRGQWSPDYTEYRINEYDIDRGDTSVVTFGANPHTSIEARARRFALTNDLARIAPVLERSERQVLAEALQAAEPDDGGVRPWRLGERAAKDLREIRAAVADGSLMDAQARASLCAVLDDLANGGGLLAGPDGPLSVLLGVSERQKHSDPPAVLNLAFLEAELDSTRVLS